MNRTDIEYLDYTWNPAHGCTPISEGCRKCWAKTMAHRLAGMGTRGYDKADPFKVVMCPWKLDEPLKVKKPSRIGVVFMGDLFHRDVPFEFVVRVFQVMAENPQHTFLLLTKRPERMAAFYAKHWRRDKFGYYDRGGKRRRRPNLYLRRPGCAECRSFFLGCLRGRKKWKDEADTPNFRPADHRDFFGHLDNICDGFKWSCSSVGHGVAVEMNTGEISVREGDLTGLFPAPLKNIWLGVTAENQKRLEERYDHLLVARANKRLISFEPLLGPASIRCAAYKALRLPESEGLGIDWVIVGGQSGPGCEYMDPDWARQIRDECRINNIPFFMKQMSGATARERERIPVDLQIRQYPK